MLNGARGTSVSAVTGGKECVLRAIGRLFLAVAIVLSCATAQAQPGPKGPGKRPGPAHDPRVATPDEAAAAIQHAYDGISRTSLFGTSEAGPGAVSVNDIASLSKTAYQEALSCYQANNYVGAREQAMTSADLSRAVEELLMSGGAFGGGAGVPVPPTPVEERDHAARDFENLSYRLGEIKSGLRGSNALPARAAAQAQSLVSLSEQLQQQAQDLLVHNQAPRAGHVARAGDALTHAVEHLQNRYLLAAGIVPAPPPPPSRPWRRPPSPPPEPGEGRPR